MSREPEAFDQNAFDYRALSVIASHLRDNPAPPYSGRQCEELVQDARDRVFDGVVEWFRVSDRAPCAVGEQADVIFCAPGWATALSGMVTRWGSLEEWIDKTGSADHYAGVEYEWCWYQVDTDKLMVWDGAAPTLWLFQPRPPVLPEVSDAD